MVVFFARLGYQRSDTPPACVITELALLLLVPKLLQPPLSRPLEEVVGTREQCQLSNWAFQPSPNGCVRIV